MSRMPILEAVHHLYQATSLRDLHTQTPTMNRAITTVLEEWKRTADLEDEIVAMLDAALDLTCARVYAREQETPCSERKVCLSPCGNCRLATMASGLLAKVRP